jgi:hypothetical protein
MPKAIPPAFAAKRGRGGTAGTAGNDPSDAAHSVVDGRHAAVALRPKHRLPLASLPT